MSRQLVASSSGAACRLPPISRKPSGVPGAFLNRGFAFQAPAWGCCALAEVVLRRVFRQQSDQKFLRILQDIRRAPLCSFLATTSMPGCAP